MNNIVGLKELREDTERYVAQVQKGKSFVVVRRSKPIFKISPVDVWGDDGVWETVVDFHKASNGEVEVHRILGALKKLRG